jgi:catalase (peroxidase I)
MTSSNDHPRVMISFVVLCIANSVFTLGAQAVEDSEKVSKCPVMGAAKDPTRRPTAAGVYANGDWWPNQLNLQILRRIRPRVIPWVRSLTTPRSSKNSTSMP